MTIAALTLSGCVPASHDPYSESARQALATLAGLEGDDRRDAVMAIAASGEAVARTLGIDAALGGAAEADAALTQLRAPLNDLLADGDLEVQFAPASLTSASVAAAGSGAFNTFLGLAFTMIGGMGDNAMNLADQGNIGTETAALPDGNAEITIGSDGSVASSFSNEMSDGTTTASLSAATEVNACPAADGSLELTGSSSVRIAVGGASLSIELEVVATGRLDDTATLVESDYSYRHQTSSTEGGKGEFFDHSSSATTDVTVNRSSSGATLEFAQGAVDSAAVLAQMVANDLLAVAKRGWESGRCIELTITPSEDPGTLQPEAEINVEAAPTSRVDGKPAGGTVVATLSGAGSVDPAGSAVDAPATYTYVAADEEDETGTLTFESRSNRGVGKTTLALSTGGQSYAAHGSEGEFNGEGVICSLTAPFELLGSGLTFAFTPADEDGGSFRVTGEHGGVTFWGDGAYTVQHGETVAQTITIDGEIVVSTSEGISATSPTNMIIALTPIDGCE